MNLSTYANRFDIAMIKNKGKIYVNTANGVSIIYLFNHFFSQIVGFHLIKRNHKP